MSYQLDTNQSSKIIHIKSRDVPTRNRYFKNTSFSIELSNSITCLDNEYLLISLYSASIPMSFYNISTGETSFLIGSTEYNIETGNYNITTLQQTLENTIGSIIGAGVISFAYNKIKNKTTVLCNGLGFGTLTFTGIAQSLGFTNGYTIPLGVVQTYTSPNVCNIIDKYSIYLRTDLNVSNAYNTDGNLTDILERIPIKGANSVLYFEQPPSQHKSIIVPKFIKTFKIGLTYESETDFLDLNGCDFELSLKVDTVKNLERAEARPDVRTTIKAIEAPVQAAPEGQQDNFIQTITPEQINLGEAIVNPINY